MNTIDEDVARVRAVHAVLEGPQTVWVLKWQSEDDNGIVLFASEQGVRDAMVRWLDEEWEENFSFTFEEYQELRAKLVDGSDGCVLSDERGRCYSYESMELNP